MPTTKLNTPFPKKKQLSFLELFWVPLLLLIISFIADYYVIPDAIVLLPSLLLLILGYLSFRLSAGVLFLWTLVYAVAVLIMLIISPPEYNRLTPFVRATTFTIGGGVVCLLSARRISVEKSNEAFFSVVSALPMAIIVS